MMYGNWERMMDFGSHPLGVWGIGLLAIWSLFWKGLALWKSARNDERHWFIALLVINTLGILEISYMLFFSNKSYLVVEKYSLFIPQFKLRKNIKKK